MPLHDLTSNLLSPPVLFFLLGLAATLVRSDLEFPAAMAKALSLFLLFAIGFKGGTALAASGWSAEVFRTMAVALLASAVVPLWTFLTLRPRLGVTDAAAIAATYGSVSAVTFISATAFLTQRDISFSGHMVAAMALMESPAIIIGVFFARRFAVTGAGRPGMSWTHLGKDALLNGSVFLLLGSLVIGLVCGPVRGASLKPFVDLLFPGVLALFLLDLGMLAARRLRDLPKAGLAAVAFALLAPLGNAALGLGLGALAGLGQGDALLLVVLCASASYIAVPAALRIALPEANPGLYVTLALALTFPFNLVVGIPLYDLAVTAVRFG